MKKNVTQRLVKILKDEPGVTSVEYSFMAVLIGVVVVAAVTAIGIAGNNLFALALKL
jgi:Flp pilus assembly pilin Flp